MEDTPLSPARTYLTDLGLADWLTPNHPQGDAVWFSAFTTACTGAASLQPDQVIANGRRIGVGAR